MIITGPIPKKNTIRSYQQTLSKFSHEHGEKDLKTLTPDVMLSFLNKTTEGKKQNTRRTRYSYMTAFFNFIRNNVDQNYINPCDNRIMKKLFKVKPPNHWDFLEKDIVDEIIFRTTDPRNRLILELMARGGMRIGEVLKLKPLDINNRKLTLRSPKSGKEHECIFIPQKLADRLRDYIREMDLQSHQRIFSICYETARDMVEKAGRVAGIHLRPHDLRRHAATYASRSGVPIEIISKVILRHSNLSTTQMYLGTISDTEAIKWIENLHS